DVPILRERPSKSVLSAAAPDDENLHSATSRIECQAFISSRVRSTGFFFNPRYSPVTQAKHISPCFSPIPLLSPSISLYPRPSTPISLPTCVFNSGIDNTSPSTLAAS